MEFIDLAAQQKRIRLKIEANIRAVLDHGKYIMGPEISILETRLAEYVGVKHAIVCSSGTDALLMGLMAYGIGNGDAVFTTPFTFIATAEVIKILGATPVFVDIDPQMLNIDTNKLEIAISDQSKKLKEKGLTAKGIIAVDIFGLPADYNAINELGKKYGLFVIEDAAQSFGAEYYGRKACALAEIGCTSFFPAKPLGAYGDGGAIFTDNDDLVKALISIRIHGQGSDKYENIRIGINGRLDTLQAAILLAKLDIFPEELELRQEAAQRYTKYLKNSSLVTPEIPKGMKSAWAQYSILATDEFHRKKLQSKLAESRIPTAIYYPKPLHLQTAFSYLGYQQGDFPISEDYAQRIFSIPMYPYLSESDQKQIAEILTQDEM